MTLLDGQEGLLVTGVDSFSAPDEENLFINPVRYGMRGDTTSGAGSKRRSSSSDDDPTPKRQRPLRACAMTPSQSEEKKAAVQRAASAQQGSRKAKPARAKGNSAKVEKGTPVYESVEQAVKEKRLWHSVLQNPVSLEEFQEGVDSDGDRDDEHDWRLQIADDEVEEFEDTLPVEKLLMNLWNQFSFMEFNAFADHRLAPACMEFAKSKFTCPFGPFVCRIVAAELSLWFLLPPRFVFASRTSTNYYVLLHGLHFAKRSEYRRIMQKFNLEVTFLRHLTELARIGLLDSDAINAMGLILRNRDESPTTEEEGARFLFAERIIKQAEEDEKNGKKRTPNGVVPLAQ